MALAPVCLQNQDSLQFPFRCVTFCPHVHIFFSPFGCRAKLEYLSCVELQEGHFWQGEAWKQLPESGRKPRSPNILRFCDQTQPRASQRASPALPGLTPTHQRGDSKQPSWALRTSHDTDWSLIWWNTRMRLIPTRAPLKPGLAAQPWPLLAKTDLFQSLCPSGSSVLMIRFGRWDDAWSEAGTWLFVFF